MSDDADVVYLRPALPPARVERAALCAGLIAAVLLAGLVGWLGLQAYRAQHREAQGDLFVQAARDVAVNLSTVDFRHADADARRIQDSATGNFADSFAHHKQLYIDKARQSRSVSLGSVRDAGLESQSAEQGRVLVSVVVTTPGQAAGDAQFFRLRITVRRVGDSAKISDVAFVS